MKGSGIKRGALIVFEGCDKAGKTTQCKELVEKLWGLGFAAQMLQFPDRTTATGKIIDSYLAKKSELPDEAIHLLFSANRWESQPKIKQLLSQGVTLIVDRYSYSGIAYSAAKPGMSFEWCQKPEIGLPKPDLVFLLYVPTDDTSRRSGFGDERYENNKFLKDVFDNYLKMKDETWMLIDGTKSIKEVNEELTRHAKEVIEKVQTQDIKVIS